MTARLTHACGQEYEPGAVVCPRCAAPIDLVPVVSMLPVEPEVVDGTDDAGADGIGGAAVAASAEAAGAAPTAAWLKIPGHPALALPEGVAVRVGREAPDPAVRQAILGVEDNDTVSREHVELVAGRGVLTVTDLRSTNRTFVQGRAVDRVEVPLDGVVPIRLGRTVTIVVLAAEAAR